MADPRESPAEKRKAKLSPLMEAKARNATGEKVNFCPFGCSDDEVDEHGYCPHLVGFTEDGKTYEPMAAPDDQGRRKVLGGERQPLQRGDKLERITSSSRVYRRVKDPAEA